MKVLKMYEEFIGDEKYIKHYPYIKAKMKELSELVNDTLKKDYDSSAKFEYLLDGAELEITLVMDKEHTVDNDGIDSKVLTVLFDLETMLIGFYLGREEDFRVESIEEGMDLIEKKIYGILSISESKKN